MARPRATLRNHWWRGASLDSDAELLRQFVSCRADGSIETLVERHGAMVLGTCRRILRDRHLAEDAFQATFLILARRAGSVQGLLPAWLHRVAQRVCWRMQRGKRSTRELSDVASPPPADHLEQRELLAVLDDEIARLPGKHRSVIQLCYLQHRTAEDAANLLGIPRGTVLSRLDAARRKLQAAFARRGLESLAILSLPTLAVPVSNVLADTTARAARGLLHQVARPILATVSLEVFHMAFRNWFLGLGAVALLATVGGGVTLWGGPQAGDSGGGGSPAKPAPAPDAPVVVDAKVTAKAKAEIVEQKLARIQDQLQKLLREREIKSKSSDTQLNDLSESTLRAAIEREELKILDSELVVLDAKAQVETCKTELKPCDDYKVDLRSEKSINMVEGSSAVRFAACPHYKQYMQLWRKHRGAKENIEDLKKKNAAPDTTIKTLEKFFAESEAKITELQPKLELELQDVLFNEAKLRVTNSEGVVIMREAEHRKLVKRKNELAARLQNTTAHAFNPLDDDEIEVLRDLRKKLMKLQFQLQLEAAGVTVPAETAKP